MNLDAPEMQPLSPTSGPVVTKRYVGTKNRSKSVSLGTKAAGANNLNNRGPISNPPGTNPRGKSRRKRR